MLRSRRTVDGVRWNHWQHPPKMRPSVSIGGRLWTMKGKGGILDNIMVELDCHRQHVVYTPFISSKQRSVYTPSRTAIETTDGKTVESCDNPCAVPHSKACSQDTVGQPTPRLFQRLFDVDLFDITIPTQAVKCQDGRD